MSETDPYEPRRVDGIVFRLWLVFASAVGMLAAGALIVDKISYWEQKSEGKLPNLGCNLSPIVGCGPVINSPPASIFGTLPNPVFGIVAYAALLMFAVLVLARVTMPRWMWWAVQVGVVFGIGVVSYLQFESIFRLGALCPFCMVVWSITIPTFWAVTARNLREYRPYGRVSSFVYLYAPLFIVLHFTLLLSLIFAQFGSTLWA